MYWLGIVGFVLALIVSVGLHEFGHLYWAKRFHRRVTDYYIGFGPTLFRRRRGETMYGLKLLPLGGFVRMQGMMTPPESRIPRTRLGKQFYSMVNGAKQADYVDVDDVNDDRLFYRLSWPRRLIIMAAGPAVNIGLAFLCFLGVFALYGTHQASIAPGSPVISAVERCAVGTYGTASKQCAVNDESPAYRAGLRPGDAIVAVDNHPVSSWAELVAYISTHGGEQVSLTVNRGDRTLTLPAQVGTFTRPTAQGEQRRGFLGVAPTVIVDTDRKGVIYTVDYMGQRMKDVYESLTTIPSKLKNVALAIVGRQDRDPNGPVSIVGGARFSGEIAQARQADAPAGSRLASFFMLIGAFNLFIGCLNLFVPIPPLDGGQIMGCLWEGVKNTWARLRRAPKPAPVDIAKSLPLTYAFTLLILLASALLIVGDVVAPIRIS